MELLPALTQEKLDNQREVKNERQNYEDAPTACSGSAPEALFPKGHPMTHPHRLPR